MIPSLSTDPAAFRRPTQPKGIMATLRGICLLIFVVIVGFFMKVYWIGNNAIMKTRFGENDVEMVVVIGEDPSDISGLQLGPPVATGYNGTQLCPVVSGEITPLPRYVWTYQGRNQQAVYGVFPSLSATTAWAKNNSLDFGPDFRFVESSDHGIQVQLPLVKRGNRPALRVSVYTDRYDIEPSLFSAATKAEPRQPNEPGYRRNIYNELKE